MNANIMKKLTLHEIKYDMKGHLRSLSYIRLNSTKTPKNHNTMKP